MAGIQRIIKFLALPLMLALGSMGAGITASAADGDKVIYARTAVGKIHAINLEDRTAIIGGYRYQFGSPASRDTSDIKLYGYNAGSFEMLQPGMKVTMRYAEYGTVRFVLSLEELSPDTDIHERGVKIDP